MQNVYNWGDFKGNPYELMERYFDAFVYIANWGTNRLMFRLPSDAVDLEQAKPYLIEPYLTLRQQGRFTIIEFLSEDEEGGWWMDDEEAEGWMPSLLPLRAELAQGDLRSLYVVWLAAVQPGVYYEEQPEFVDDAFETYELDDDDVEDNWIERDTPEPPVPPGLGHPSAALLALSRFLRVDPDLLAVAAERSDPKPRRGPTTGELAGWIEQVPERDKNDWLLDLLAGSGQQVMSSILRRYRQEHPNPRLVASGAIPSRTVGELLSAARALADERRRREAERQARARAAYLDSLAGQEATIWQQAEDLVNRKQGRFYDEAVKLLADLRELAERQQTLDAFTARLTDLRLRHKTKVSFQERIRQAGLPQE